MAEESMKVVIGADVNQGVAGVQRFNKEIARIKPGAAQASAAMLNLGRVVQDAPFGLIGIANNIDPLLHSFQQLRKETGSVGGALKSLAGSLMGGGGIALGVSLVTSLLITFGDELFGTGKAAREAKEANDEFKKSLKDVAEIQDDAVASTQGQIATVNALAAVVTDTNKSYKERNRALQELKEINKSYFGDLTLESAQLGILKARVQEYTQALVQQAIVKKFSEEIANTTKALSDQERVVNRARQAVNIARKEEEQWFIAQGKSAALANGNTKKEIAAQKILAEENAKLTTLAEQRIHQTHELNRAVGEGLKLRNIESVAVKKVKEEVDAIRHARIIDLEDLAAAQRLLDIINGIRTPKKTAFTPGAVPEFTGLPTKEIIVKTQTDFEKAMDDLEATMEERLKALSVTLATGFGESLGAILGGADFGQAISSFVGLVGDALISIGRIAIETGVALIKLKIALTSMFKSPGALIAVGVGLVALGSLIKTKIPKFAEGGIVTKPTLGLFGEAGPEAIIPLHKMNQMGPGAIQVFGVLEARGNKLLAVINRAERSHNRIT